MTSSEYQVVDSATKRVVATYKSEAKAKEAAEILSDLARAPDRFKVEPVTFTRR